MEIDFSKRSLPFTLYDFFGYLLPGLTFGGLLLVSCDAPRFLALGLTYFRGERVAIATSSACFDYMNLASKHPLFVAVVSMLAAYVLGHIIAALSSFLLERLIVELWLGYPTANLFGVPRRGVWIFRKYRRAYSKEFVDEFQHRFKDTFGRCFKNESDTFWLTFEFVGQNCPVAFSRAIHFLNLYGFSRNLSMTLILAAMILIVIHSLHWNNTWFWGLVLIYLIGTGALFWNYLKLLKRLNDEVYRAFYSYVATSMRGAAGAQGPTGE